jgi:hypothetical protein
MQTAQSFSELSAAMRVKFSRYDLAMCAYAIKDCHETLAINPDADPAYVQKLWAEIDAARERAMKLSKGSK